MATSVRQGLKVGGHLLRQRMAHRERYPLVVEVEPLFACNLQCPGCGKTAHPADILSRRMTVAEVVAGVEECGAPVVSIAGGEPLVHKDIGAITEALIKRRKLVYLCTNGLLLRKKLDLFRPSPYFAWAVHVDGVGQRHDDSVGREGVFAEAVAGIKAAQARGFRVTTNSTVFASDSAKDVIELLDFLCLDLKVDSAMVSPGYAQAGASAGDAFLQAEETRRLFREVLGAGRRRWRLNHSPLYLDFLTGRLDLVCSPWAIPSLSVLGWQRPCYMLADGYAASYQELLDSTDWPAYGRGKDPRCADCMAHSGYEPSAVTTGTGSPLQMLRSYLRR
jgi:hopanoid biosynthesis associated radical SAM protein HpnH